MRRAIRPATARGLRFRRVKTVEVDMYVGENHVVCVHARSLRELDRVRRKLLAGNDVVASAPANVAHTVFDAVVVEYLPIMNRLSAMVVSTPSSRCA